MLVAFVSMFVLMQNRQSSATANLDGANTPKTFHRLGAPPLLFHELLRFSPELFSGSLAGAFRQVASWNWRMNKWNQI